MMSFAEPRDATTDSWLSTSEELGVALLAVMFVLGPIMPLVGRLFQYMSHCRKAADTVDSETLENKTANKGMTANPMFDPQEEEEDEKVIRGILNMHTGSSATNSDGEDEAAVE